jgi:integrase
MASIQRIVSPLTSEVSYRAQIRVKGRASESETFPNRKEAEAWAASVESAIREGRHFPHAAAKRTSFDALAKDYINTVLPEFDETQRAARTLHLDWWANQFGGKSVSEITKDVIAKARDACAAETFTKSPRIPDDVSRKILELAKADKTHRQIAAEAGQSLTVVRRVVNGKTKPKEHKRSGATVNRYIATLSAVLSFAVDERSLLDRNPVSSVSRKVESRGRTRFLLDAERTALVDACTKSDWAPLHTLVLLAISTGARRGELLSLRWADVDLKAGRALVRESKNGEQRTLPLAGKALDALRALKLNGSGRSEWVFPNPSGHPGPFENFDAQWYAALEAAGISDFHFHDLRHTTASMLAAQGASLLEIADVLGHKTLAMVKRYSHLVVDHKAKVIERMVAAKGL